MRFYSTNTPNQFYSLKEAVFHGLAPDGGLFMPDSTPLLSREFLKSLSTLSFQELATEIASQFLPEISKETIKKMLAKSLNFDAPLVKLDEDIYVLELFHGPTLSFKDFGACFMAEVISHLQQKEKQLNILVATSGDTGSAVANGFYGLPGIKVWVLYPQGKVTPSQEKQFTTYGGNVRAIEVQGSFDDCQALVKKAFSDTDLTKQIGLTSANSINIARLIPQIFYYVYAYAQLKKPSKPVVISVPSGNFGNLTAGLFAWKMGLPIHQFIAATNINDSVPKYLRTGQFTPHASLRTLSNAMDVGNPSNFARMQDLFNKDLKAMREVITAFSFSDLQTQEAIKELYVKFGYVADPHGAVAYLGLVEYLKRHSAIGIFLETAHPAKFLEVVNPLINAQIAIPERLKKVLAKEKQSLPMVNDYETLKKQMLKDLTVS